jgi:hypothetical protein
MPTRRFSMLVRTGSVLSLALVIGACTSGGQFDPTDMFSSDIFNTKKRVQGDREPLFPNGVPGTETGVPPDLVKGYQPPPEQSADSSDATAKPAAATAKPEDKPKPKPKPKVAGQTPAKPAHDAAWDQKAGSPTPQPAPTPASAPPAQGNWPAPPAAQVQTNWPAPPPTQSSQTNWPAPPPTKPAQ